MIDRSNEIANVYFCCKLFGNLPYEGLLMGFAWLDFSTGEFPFLCRFAGIFSLGTKNTIVLY